MKGHEIPTGRGSISGRTILERRAVHIVDILSDPEYKDLDAQKTMSFRTALGVPLLRRRTLIGVMILQRRTVRAFTPKQIELATTFADQAVIAIENVRLFDEVQARTRELSRVAGAADRDLGGAAGYQSSRRASWSQSFKPCWRTPPVSATPSSARCSGSMEMLPPGGAGRCAAGLAEFFGERGPYRPQPGVVLDRLLRTKQVDSHR